MGIGIGWREGERTKEGRAEWDAVVLEGLGLGIRDRDIL